APRRTTPGTGTTGTWPTAIWTTTRWSTGVWISMADPAHRGRSRRSVLTGGAAAALGGVVTGGAVGYAGHGLQDAGAAEAPDWRAVADSEAVGAATEPFYGARQAGVTTPPQANAAFVGIDIIDAETRAVVQGSLQPWP